MAGKGDKWRKTDFKKYFENFPSLKKVNSKESKDDNFVKCKSKITKKY
jgi:hypothetical protein